MYIFYWAKRFTFLPAGLFLFFSFDNSTPISLCLLTLSGSEWSRPHPPPSHVIQAQPINQVIDCSGLGTRPMSCPAGFHGIPPATVTMLILCLCWWLSLPPCQESLLRIKSTQRTAPSWHRDTVLTISLGQLVLENSSLEFSCCITSELLPWPHACFFAYWSQDELGVCQMKLTERVDAWNA